MYNPQYDPARRNKICRIETDVHIDWKNRISSSSINVKTILTVTLYILCNASTMLKLERNISRKRNLHDLLSLMHDNLSLPIA